MTPYTREIWSNLKIQKFQKKKIGHEFRTTGPYQSRTPRWSVPMADCRSGHLSWMIRVSKSDRFLAMKFRFLVRSPENQIFVMRPWIFKFQWKLYWPCKRKNSNFWHRRNYRFSTDKYRETGTDSYGRYGGRFLAIGTYACVTCLGIHTITKMAHLVFPFDFSHFKTWGYDVSSNRNAKMAHFAVQ